MARPPRRFISGLEVSRKNNGMCTIFEKILCCLPNTSEAWYEMMKNLEAQTEVELLPI
jgi:hypothetical protein